MRERRRTTKDDVRDSYIRMVNIGNHRLTLPAAVFDALRITEEHPYVELYRMKQENGEIEFRIRSATPRDMFTGQLGELIEYKGCYFSPDTIHELENLLKEREGEA